MIASDQRAAPQTLLPAGAPTHSALIASTLTVNGLISANHRSAAGIDSTGGLSGAPYRYQARVTLQAPAEEVTRRSPYMWGSVEAIDESTCEYKTGDDSLDWLAMRVGMLGVDFEVHEPPELIERFELLAGRFGRAASTE